MSLIRNFRHRPEIDGLRAIAVLAVLLFHGGLGMSGGYVGVDIFFVISGFLITSLILRDLEEDRFSLINFWERRARRIIPACLVMVLITLIAGVFLLLPTDFKSLAKSTIWQSAFVANFYFWKNTNYFAGVAEEQPLLHTWSLAVEEQFYLFVPVFLLILFKFAPLRKRPILVALLLFGFVGSLAFSMLVLPRLPAAAFYLLPCRAWELLCGSIVALIPALPMRRALREGLCGLAMALILAPCFLYTKQTPFPGAAALPPCLGTALYIFASASNDPQSKLPWAARLLSTRPFVFIGLISYSLYLWHWPLLAFSTYWALEPLSLAHRTAMIALAFPLAVLSWRYVETPFRVRKLGARRSTMFAYAGGLLGMSAIAALVVVLMQGFPSRFSPQVLAFDAAKAESDPQNRIVDTVGLEDAVAGRFPRLGVDAPAPVQLMVWGDSHARSILPAAIKISADHGAAVLTAWHSSTPPVLGYEPHPDYVGFSLGNQSPAFNRAVLAYIGKHRIPNVLLAARWRDYFDVRTEAGLGLAPDAFANALIHTVTELRKAGCRPWILLEVPNHSVPVPKALISKEIFGTDISPFICSQSKMEFRHAPMRRILSKLEQAGARLIDPTPLLLDASHRQFLMQRDGIPLFYDAHHLTQFGARSIAPALAPIFSAKDSP